MNIWRKKQIEVMDQEKLFTQENHEMNKRVLMSCCEKMNERKLHGYYANNKKEALNIMSTLLSQFGEEWG